MAGYISVPIKSRRATVGALTLHSRTPGAYGETDLGWAQDLGQRIGLSIENRRLLLEARQLFEQSVSANFVSTPDGTMLTCNQTFAVTARIRVHPRSVRHTDDVALRRPGGT